MKDSKTIRNEHQSFVDAYKKINESSVQDKPVEEGYGYKSMDKKKKKTKKEEMVLVRKSNAFTAIAEKYNMSPKQFGRYVEANQHLFDIPTRRKATLANKFQGFKETKEWDEFFGDLELVEMGLLKKNGKFKMPDDKKDIIDDGKGTDYKKIFKLKKGANLDKAHYEPEGELVDEGAPYEVTNADKSGNTPAYQGLKSGKKNAITGKALYKAAPHLKLAHNELEGEDLQEITTKDTKSGTKFKVRVKDKATGSSYIRFATRDKIAQLRSDPKIASVEMTDEGQTPEERGEKKAQAAGGGSPKKAKKDYDGDGKIESGKAEYMGSRDKAIKKAMKKRSVTTEEVVGPAKSRSMDYIRKGAIEYELTKDMSDKVYKKHLKRTGNFKKGGPYNYKHLESYQHLDEINAGNSTEPDLKTTISKIRKTEPENQSKEFGPKGQPSASVQIKKAKFAGLTGKEKAQAMAKERIKSGKTISDVKKSNKDAMRARAAERFKAFKARRMTKEELSNWREDLKEIMGEVEKTEGKKSKSKKMKNGICINPDTDDEKNKYEEVKPMTSVTGDGSKLSPRHAPGGDLSQYNKDGTKKTPSTNKKRGTAFIKAQEAAESLGAELQSLKIEDADGNVAYEVVDLVKPDPMKENVMLTYKSGKGFDAKVGGISARDTVSNIKKAGETIKNIKSDGLVGGVKKTFNKKTTEKPSVSSNIDSALKNYKSTISSSYEMETEDLQQTVTNILDKGSDFMKNTRVGRVLGKVVGPWKKENKGSDYTPKGKVAR